MIVAMQETATEEQIQDIIGRLVDLGFNVHRTTGAQQTILAGVGTPSAFDHKDFALLAGVARELLWLPCPFALGLQFGKTLRQGLGGHDRRPLIGSRAMLRRTPSAATTRSDAQPMRVGNR